MNEAISLFDFVPWTRQIKRQAYAGGTTRKRFTRAELDVWSSPASRQGFKFISKGYFYSQYKATDKVALLRAPGMALEGSILDFQIADVVNGLFDQCNAGDVRISYDAILLGQEKGAAVLGELEKSNVIRVFETEIGLFENTADTSPDEMLGRLLRNALEWIVVAHAVTVGWTAVLTYYYPLNAQRTDVYAWTAEAVALVFMTLGGVKVVFTNETVVGLIALAIAGCAFLSLRQITLGRAKRNGNNFEYSAETSS
ncbi:hypothetical protein HDU98_009183 [Podochytrium sp. JEL0797]|nr:hypothetical protein HDU98_009183 [Podochytrium sp. JEL0797]